MDSLLDDLCRVGLPPAITITGIKEDTKICVTEAGENEIDPIVIASAESISGGEFTFRAEQGKRVYVNLISLLYKNKTLEVDIPDRDVRIRVIMQIDENYTPTERTGAL